MELTTDMSNDLMLVSDKFRALGTDISIDIVINEAKPPIGGFASNKKRAEQAILAAKDIFFQKEKIFSRFDENSELSQLNKNIGKETKISADMAKILELCLKFHRESEGFFDPRVIGNLEKIGYNKDFRANDLNSAENAEIQLEKITDKLENDLILNKEKKTVLARKRIDTTGIAKGYIVDKAAESLQFGGFDNFIVDAGGDMFGAGLNERQAAWQVGVEGCEDARLMLKLSGEGIATSGISRKRWQKGNKKFHHLINPKDPENFSCDLKTVTVIKDKTVEADGKAKVLFIMGVQRGMEFANEHKIKALFLDYCGNVFLSEAMKENIVK